jgi:hypothetical protein
MSPPVRCWTKRLACRYNASTYELHNQAIMIDTADLKCTSVFLVYSSAPDVNHCWGRDPLVKGNPIVCHQVLLQHVLATEGRVGSKSNMPVVELTQDSTRTDHPGGIPQRTLPPCTAVRRFSR